MSGVDLTIARLHRWLRLSIGILARLLAPFVSADILSVLRALCAIPVVGITLLGGPAAASVGFYVGGWCLDFLDGAVAEERERRGFAHDADRGEFIDVVCDKCLLLSVLALLMGARLPEDEAAYRVLFSATLAISLLLEAALLGKRAIDYRAGRTQYVAMPAGKMRVFLQAIATTILLASFADADTLLAKSAIGVLAVAIPMSAASLLGKFAGVSPAQRGDGALS